MKNIIIVGSINMDIVAQMDKHPENGETVFGKKISFIPGGKGANQARAISRLEGKVALVGKVGKDQFGKSLLRSLNTDGINTGNIKISQNNTTGVALIGVDRQAENRIIIVSGANFDLSPKDISKIDLQKNTIAISQFEVPQNTIKAFFKKAKKAKAQTILNPSPTGKIPPDLLELVDYLIVNEHEFAYLSNTKKLQIDSASLAKNANRIVAIDQVIITTFGAKGSVAIKGSKVIKPTDLRKHFGAFEFRSTFVTRISPVKGGYELAGHGWGHGVGMCQEGAKYMAFRGKPYKKILRHYYPGAAIIDYE